MPMNRLLILCVVAALMAPGCGGKGGGDEAPPPITIDPPSASLLSVEVGLKQLKFSWTASAGADFYRLLRDPDGVSGFTQVGVDIPGSAASVDLDISVLFLDWPSARFALEACNGGGAARSNDVGVPGETMDAIGYFKSSNPGENDAFGTVALSADGTTLAVGAFGECSGSTGINGDQDNDLAHLSGAVYVFTKTGGTWTQQAYIKASNAEASDQFGIEVALSADGDTLAVGAPFESSGAVGIDGDPSDNSAQAAGAVYVFTRTGGVWTQQAYIKASNTEVSDLFARTIALSGDGDTLAVGAYGEDSGAAGIDGVQSDNSAQVAGAAYVFMRSGGVWTQQAYIKASNTEAVDLFGFSVALSGDGDTLAVGAVLEDSGAMGIGGDQADNSAAESGAVYVFTRSGGIWIQQAYIKASNGEAGDMFGWSVALSADGAVLAASTIEEGGSGAAYMFTRSAGAWSETAFLKASNAGAGDYFGASVALSGDGHVLAVGAINEASDADGIGGLEADESAQFAGAVYVFTDSGGTWLQRSYVKATNSAYAQQFGYFIALSFDGGDMAVGALGESSNATGVGGDQSDASIWSAGAVYLY